MIHMLGFTFPAQCAMSILLKVHGIEHALIDTVEMKTTVRTLIR
jgi:hypothetical protein